MVRRLINTLQCNIRRERRADVIKWQERGNRQRGSAMKEDSNNKQADWAMWQSAWEFAAYKESCGKQSYESS